MQHTFRCMPNAALLPMHSTIHSFNYNIDTKRTTVRAIKQTFADHRFTVSFGPLSIITFFGEKKGRMKEEMDVLVRKANDKQKQRVACRQY